MFTGIITDIGSVKSVQKTDGGKRLTITTALDISQTDLGASIACAGACMTVVEKGYSDSENWFQVDVSDESLSKTPSIPISTHNWRRRRWYKKLGFHYHTLRWMDADPWIPELA